MQFSVLLTLFVLATSTIAAPMWPPPPDEAEKLAEALSSAVSGLSVEESGRPAQAATGTQAWTSFFPSTAESYADNFNAHQVPPIHEDVPLPATVYHSESESSHRVAQTTSKLRGRFDKVRIQQPEFKRPSPSKLLQITKILPRERDTRGDRFVNVVRQMLLKHSEDEAGKKAADQAEKQAEKQSSSLWRQPHVTEADLDGVDHMDSTP